MDTIHKKGELMTAAEAMAFLRLDSIGLKKPKEALRYLRRLKRIGAVKVGKVYMYLRSDLERYIAQYRVPPVK